MLLGQTFFKMDGEPAYTPEFARGGLEGLFAVDVLDVVGSPSVTVTIQSRDETDTSWTDTAAFVSFSTTGLISRDATGLKELVRLKFAFDAGDAATDGCRILIRAPAWRPE